MSTEREARTTLEDAILRAAQPATAGAPCPVVTVSDVRAMDACVDARAAAALLNALERRRVVVRVTKGMLEGIVQWPRRSRARTGWVSGAALEAVQARLQLRLESASTFAAAVNPVAGNSDQHRLRERAEQTVLARHRDEVDAEYTRLLAPSQF